MSFFENLELNFIIINTSWQFEEKYFINYVHKCQQFLRQTESKV